MSSHLVAKSGETKSPKGWLADGPTLCLTIENNSIPRKGNANSDTRRWQLAENCSTTFIFVTPSWGKVKYALYTFFLWLLSVQVKERYWSIRGAERAAIETLAKLCLISMEDLSGATSTLTAMKLVPWLYTILNYGKNSSFSLLGVSSLSTGFF